MKKLSKFYAVIFFMLVITGIIGFQWITIGKRIESETLKAWPVLTHKEEQVEDKKQWTFEEPLVFVTGEYPPYVYSDRGQVKGLAIEIFKEVMAEMNQEYTLEMISWSRGLQLMETGQAFATFPYAETEARKEDYIFTRMLYKPFGNKDYFYFYKDNLGSRSLPDSMETLKYSRVGGIYGYYTLEWYRDQGIDADISVDEVEALQKLKDGKIDTIAFNPLVGKYFIQNYFAEDQDQFVRSELGISNGSLGDCIMLGKDNPLGKAFIERFNRAYEALEKRGVIELIEKKYNFE